MVLCISSCYVSRPARPPDLDPEPFDFRAYRCDPHEGAPLAVPDFLAETLGQLDPKTRSACPLSRVPRGRSGVVSPPSVDMTAEAISLACANVPEGCAPVCEAVLAAEVALRVFRRVQSGVGRLHGSPAGPRCGRLLTAASSTVAGEPARALLACLDVPIPSRVEPTLKLQTDASGYRRIVDIAVQADFVPRRARDVTGKVHRLELVAQDSGCGHVSRSWVLVRDTSAAQASPELTCSESGDEHCRVVCQDLENAACSFERVWVGPAPSP